MRATRQKFVFRMIIGRQFFLISNLQWPRNREYVRRFVCHWEQHDIEAFLSFIKYHLSFSIVPTNSNYIEIDLKQEVARFLCPSLPTSFEFPPFRYRISSAVLKKKVERRQYFTLCFVKYFCLPIPRYIVQLFPRCCHTERIGGFFQRFFFLSPLIPLSSFKLFITPPNKS